jgi:hypothetical protein
MPLLATAHVASSRAPHAHSAAVDSSALHMTSVVSANWQLLADYQPRDKEQALPFLLDSIAALQDNVVQLSLECVREEALLSATSRRLQQLENEVSTCVSGAADAESAEDRKAYYDVVRKLWMERSLLQKDEVRMLERLRQLLESKSKLRAQLLDKQQAMLTLGLMVPTRVACSVQSQRALTRRPQLSRRSCRCPVPGCPCSYIDSIVALRAHLDKAHGIVMQDIVDSQGATPPSQAPQLSASCRDSFQAGMLSSRTSCESRPLCCSPPTPPACARRPSLSRRVCMLPLRCFICLSSRCRIFCHCFKASMTCPSGGIARCIARSS